MFKIKNNNNFTITQQEASDSFFEKVTEQTPDYSIFDYSTHSVN